MQPPLEFWFEFAGTYSYPAAQRIEALCANAGVFWGNDRLEAAVAWNGRAAI